MPTSNRIMCLLSILLLICCKSVAADETVVIKHFDQDYSPKLRQYLTEVLDLVLEETRDEYGDYRVEYYSRSLSPTRSKKETERGDTINTLFAPDWLGPYLDIDKVIRLTYPVFNGLLGFRAMIVNQSDVARFESIDSISEFKALRAGLGTSWSEVDILTSNKLNVVESQTYDSLFPMLSLRRYDYLPLSILEVYDSVSNVPDHQQRYTIVDNVTIFYPFPFYLYVNKQYPELAQRLQRGLDLAASKGSLPALFSRSFPDIEMQLRKQPKKVMLLHNPFLTASENAVLTKRFIDQYGDRLEILR